MQLPAGAYLIRSGQFEYLQRAEARLQVVVPVTLMIIFLLLYLNFRDLAQTLIVMLSLPFAQQYAEPVNTAKHYVLLFGFQGHGVLENVR